MSITSMLIGFSTRQSASRFEEATKDPVGTQTQKILAMVKKNADTEYGKKYGFSSIETIGDYQCQVPVINYEDIKADMARVIHGSKKVFTAEDPVMFAQTSGTTGDPKYIPVTPTCQGQEHKDVMRTWLYHALQSHRDIFGGKVVSLVSPAIEGHTPSGLPYGSTSGHMYKNMSWIVRRIYGIPYEVFEISDYTAKYYAVMRIALEQDVRFLATANPSSILKLCEKADEFSEEIIRDIRDGSLSQSFEIEPQIRQSLEGKLRPNPGCAGSLESARSRAGGKLKPCDYWPRLSLIGCWKGGTVGHYLKKFPDLFSGESGRPVPVRDWGYLSSEARGSIPLSDEGSAGVLTVASNFFEFVATDDLEGKGGDPGKWNFLTVGDIEEGKEYYIFVTTTGGLWRYDINDVIKVVGKYNQTPQIVFLRKGRGMTNLTGEKVSVNQIITSFQEASQETGVVVDHFLAEADLQKSRYIFRVEFATRVDEVIQESFLKCLDSKLKGINIEYKTKRDSLRLSSPVLHVMREGWYERRRQAQVAGGMRAFQAKTQLLSPVKQETQEVLPELENIVEIKEEK